MVNTIPKAKPKPSTRRQVPTTFHTCPICNHRHDPMTSVCCTICGYVTVRPKEGGR